jgi:hypothetical protein
MFLTIGHSNIDFTDFTAALAAARVDVLIDVRSHPTSRHPQFRREFLQDMLGEHYEWWPSLGGWTEKHMPYAEQMLAYGVDVAAYSGGKFPKQRIGATRAEKTGWANQGLHDYQFFMMLPEFQDALTTLLERSESQRIAIMCAEALFWKCHRSMIADNATYWGHPVYHVIYRFRKIKQPRCVVNLVNHAEHYARRIEAYHPDVLAAWFLP